MMNTAIRMMRVFAAGVALASAFVDFKPYKLAAIAISLLATTIAIDQ